MHHVTLKNPLELKRENVPCLQDTLYLTLQKPLQICCVFPTTYMDNSTIMNSDLNPQIQAEPKQSTIMKLVSTVHYPQANFELWILFCISFMHILFKLAYT